MAVVGQARPPKASITANIYVACNYGLSKIGDSLRA